MKDKKKGLLHLLIIIAVIGLCAYTTLVGITSAHKGSAKNIKLGLDLAGGVSDIGGLNEIVDHRVNGMKAYCGNPNSIADSILELLYDHKLCADITKKAKNKVRNEYNWNKIAQDTHFAYQKAICQSMAEKQKREIEQERARKTQKADNSEKQITNLLNFRKRQAYA